MWVGIYQQIQLARQVVDHRQFFGLQQQNVRTAQGVGWTCVQQLFFNMPHGVIAKIARESATKPRHTGAQRHFETLLVGGDEIQRIAMVGFNDDTVGHHLGVRLVAKTLCTQKSMGGQADETVAPESLATHHRFQQKTVFAAVMGECQFQIQREWRFQIGKRLGHQGNTVIALCGQTFKFEFRDHREPPQLSPSGP